MTARKRAGLTVDFGVRWHNYETGDEYDEFGYTLEQAKVILADLACVEKNIVRPVAVVVCERTPTRIMEVE